MRSLLLVERNGTGTRENGIAGALEKTEGKYKQVSSKGESGLVQVGEQ